MVELVETQYTRCTESVWVSSLCASSDNRSIVTLSDDPSNRDGRHGYEGTDRHGRPWRSILKTVPSTGGTGKSLPG